MIEIKNVSKKFGTVRALKDVSLQLEMGHIYGLLGSNGAGKTTLLNIITNRIYPDKGSVDMDGIFTADNDLALGRIFMMGEVNLYPEDMRVKKAIKSSSIFYPDFDKEYAYALSDRFGLDINKKITKLSTGYRSIFRIIMALASNAPYILMDEPVLGLDAAHRDLFYRLLLEKFTVKNCCIVLSTHLIQEAERLVDRCIIIRSGEILQVGDTEELLSGCYTVSGPAGLVDSYISGKKVISTKNLGGLKSASITGAPEDVPEGLELGSLNLQDFFLAMMDQEDKK